MYMTAVSETFFRTEICGPSGSDEYLVLKKRRALIYDAICTSQSESKIFRCTPESGTDGRRYFFGSVVYLAENKRYEEKKSEIF